MKIAITGASGHVGANLCRYLLDAGHKVTALVHTHNVCVENSGLRVIKGDLLKKDSLKALVEGAEVVYHLAAGIPIYKNAPIEYEINLTGTENILKVSQSNSIKRFIHFSSIHAFKRKPMEQELNENRALDVSSSFDYVRSKALAEKMVTEANGKGLETIVLSPTAVIGPHDYKPSLLGDAVIRFYKGKAPALIPGGYDWVDVRDLCIAAIHAIEMGQPGEKYILSGHWRSLKEMTDIIHRLGGAKPPLLTVPFAIAMASAPLLNLYSKIRKQSPLYTNVTLDAVARSHRIISSRKAKTTLKYSPRPFEETVADTIRWFKEEHYI